MDELAWIFKSALADLIRWALSGPDQPRYFKYRLLREEDGMKNVFELGLPELKTGNPQKVNIRRFKAIESDADGSNQADVMSQDFSFDQTAPFELKLTHDKIATLSLIDIDVKGLESKELVHTFTVTDEIGPDMPGPFRMTLLREENGETPPEPQPESILQRRHSRKRVPKMVN